MWVYPHTQASGGVRWVHFVFYLIQPILHVMQCNMITFVKLFCFSSEKDIWLKSSWVALNIPPKSIVLTEWLWHVISFKHAFKTFSVYFTPFLSHSPQVFLKTLWLMLASFQCTPPVFLIHIFKIFLRELLSQIKNTKYEMNRVCQGYSLTGSK